jgi:hypothetical protein
MKPVSCTTAFVSQIFNYEHYIHAGLLLSILSRWLEGPCHSCHLFLLQPPEAHMSFMKTKVVKPRDAIQRMLTHGN